MFQVDVDFASTDTVQHVLRLIRKHQGRIIDFDPEGPAGGNPNILLSFKTHERAFAFLREHSRDDSITFHMSRIEQISP